MGFEKINSKYNGTRKTFGNGPQQEKFFGEHLEEKKGFLTRSTLKPYLSCIGKSRLGIVKGD
ncbi:hypothetical protein B4167_1925 [Caldibacillus thermoamylovorans]|uniref:Uncharacterized protein n=1 Tax=Caldibacillus thermoamylovorans TaxID=35841 RepID=A0ABD4A918_9BACI|nr:hypothetical protein B4167_1925 [Caldibacillus thermoamylovorans]